MFSASVPRKTAPSAETTLTAWAHAEAGSGRVSDWPSTGSARLRVVESEQQVDDRRLAGAGRADQCGHDAGLEREVTSCSTARSGV